MKNILIVSATSKTNFSLGKNLNNFCKELGATSKIISLEDYMLPLYTDEVYDLQKDNYITMIEKLTEYFIDTKGLIICGPEYNGSTAPIITNTIAWISVSTKNWRDAFNNKISLVATSSGGPGTKFFISMKMQL